MNAVKILKGAIVIIALVLWSYAIYQAIHLSLIEKPKDFAPFFSESVTLIGAILATNLGAVMGLSAAKVPGYSLNIIVSFNNDKVKGLQVIASYIYFISLVIIGFFWFKTGFSKDPEKVVQILPNMTSTFIGIIVGTLAVSLGVKE